jgi:LacI family transcriptional regulator
MTHLLEIGRRRIAYMAPYTTELIDSGPRYEAYASAMSDAGLELQTLTMESVTFQNIKESLEEAIAVKKLPEAIFCMNDEIAIAAATVLQDNGISVGKDVAIVGFDGIEETEHCSIPITTVRQPIEEMCNLAYQFLKFQLDDSQQLHQTILVPKLVKRESTRS